MSPLLRETEGPTNYIDHDMYPQVTRPRTRPRVTPSDLLRVEIVYSYENLGPEVIDFLVKQGVKGIVLAGVGDGNSTDAAIAAPSSATKKGVAVVRSSRTGSGLVVRNVEVDTTSWASSPLWS